MKIATISEIRSELKSIPRDSLEKVCLRLAAFKNDNKALVNYVLFESRDEIGYINAVKEEMYASFDEMNASNVYYAKKRIRRILRELKKCISYSDRKQTELELLISFCQRFIECGSSILENKVLARTYRKQIERINKVLDSLHEDERADYSESVGKLESHIRDS